MFERFHRKSAAATAAALIAALGVGGIAVAQNAGSTAKAPAAATKAVDNHADGETNDDGPGAKGSQARDTPEPGDKPDASEKGEGAEKNDKSDAAEKGEKPDQSDAAEGPESAAGAAHSQTGR